MHLDPTDDDARRLFRRGIEGPPLMLNLHRTAALEDSRLLPIVERELP
jgi:hypothetical protein